MGLTGNFHGKGGGGGRIFLTSEGGPEFFCDKNFLHQAPSQVFVNGPLADNTAMF